MKYTFKSCPDLKRIIKENPNAKAMLLSSPSGSCALLVRAMSEELTATMSMLLYKSGAVVWPASTQDAGWLFAIAGQDKGLGTEPGQWQTLPPEWWIVLGPLTTLMDCYYALKARRAKGPITEVEVLGLEGNNEC